MNARAEMPEPDSELVRVAFELEETAREFLIEDRDVGITPDPDMAHMLNEWARGIRSWLAAQTLAPEGGDDRPASMYGLVNAVPPAPAREAVAWAIADGSGGVGHLGWMPMSWRDSALGTFTLRDGWHYVYAYRDSPAAGAVVVDEAAKLAALIEVMRPALGLGGTPDDEFTPELMAKTIKHWRDEGHEWFTEVMNRGGEIMELRAKVAALTAAIGGGK